MIEDSDSEEERHEEGEEVKYLKEEVTRLRRELAEKAELMNEASDVESLRDEVEDSGIEENIG